VKQFDAAFVGGEPHKRHFASLGIPAAKIFTGYDAVDNARFAARTDEVRSMEHGAWSTSRGQKAKNCWLGRLKVQMWEGSKSDWCDRRVDGRHMSAYLVIL
jgi:hypothetical protein